MDASGPVPNSFHFKNAVCLAHASLRKSYVKAGIVRNGIGPDETC